jgi:4-diphosphocytidyl-2-C-methyl-D-erythritol kinase
MSAGPRGARVRAFAKINRGLRVLYRRPDGYHELRTVFQTVSLSDTLEFSFTPGRRTVLSVDSRPPISDNLVERAARMVLETGRATGAVDIRLNKRIPMGAGLGGGSSDAAAVLLALPVLAGRRLSLESLLALAAQLGSDVPFFLLGGTAVAVGRGTELYPLPDEPLSHAVLVAPELPVSTARAYQLLGRGSGSQPGADSCENDISNFQSWVWRYSCRPLVAAAGNDFEAVVFSEYPQLMRIKRRLERAGAAPAMLSGSGSCVYGLFDSRSAADGARALLRAERAWTVSLVSRRRYQSGWWRGLAGHIAGNVWPPQSRYA